MLTFGREPAYVRAAELPPQLADDPKLRIEKVDSAPPDMEVIELLKPERVQDPAPGGPFSQEVRDASQSLPHPRLPPEDHASLPHERARGPHHHRLGALGGSAAFLEILRRWLQRRQEKRQEQLQLDVLRSATDFHMMLVI